MRRLRHFIHHPPYQRLGMAALAVIMFAWAGWEYANYRSEYTKKLDQLEHRLTSAQSSVYKTIQTTIKQTHNTSMHLAKQLQQSRLPEADWPRRLPEILSHEQHLRSISILHQRSAEDGWVRYQATRTSSGKIINTKTKIATNPLAQHPHWAQKKSGLWNTLQDHQHSIIQFILPVSPPTKHEPTRTLIITDIAPWHWKTVDLALSHSDRSFAYMIDDDHMIILHPHKSLIHTQIFSHNEQQFTLKKIKIPLQKLLKDKGRVRYKNTIDQKEYWVLIEKIKPSNLYLVYKINSTRWFSHLHTIQPMLTVVYFCLSIGLISMILLVCHYKCHADTFYPTLRVLICIGTILMTIVILKSHITSQRIHPTKANAIQSSYDLNRFIKKNLGDHHPKTLISTGIQVNSIDKKPGTNNYTLNATIWQHYPIKITAPRFLPILFVNDAQMTRSQLIYTTQTKNGTIAAWQTLFNIQQPSNIQHYPFDNSLIQIQMLPTQLNAGYQLIPNLNTTPLHMTHYLPGINPILLSINKRIHESYFALTPTATGTHFGLHNYHKKNPYVLSFNIQHSRNYTQAIILFFLPLLVILVAGYIATILIQNDIQQGNPPGGRAYACIGLLFVIALTQMRFHQHYYAITITFFDAILIYCYFLVMAIITADVLHLEKISIKKLFWPVTTSFLCLTTWLFFA